MRSRKVSTERLRGVVLFADCDDRTLEHVSRLGTEIRVPRSMPLAVEGMPGFEFFVIVEGTATVSLGGIRLASLQPGDFFGEMALIENAPRSATVIAETPMSLIVFDPREFETLMHDAPEVSRAVMRAISGRLRALQGPPRAPRAKEAVS
jgi:CRP-like cAMP-binding protein